MTEKTRSETEPTSSTSTTSNTPADASPTEAAEAPVASDAAPSPADDEAPPEPKKASPKPKAKRKTPASSATADDGSSSEDLSLPTEVAPPTMPDGPVEVAPAAVQAEAAKVVAEAPAAATAAAEEASGDETETTEPLPETFAELGVPERILSALAAMGWTKPTPVQAKAYDPLCEGQDLLVQSHTGSGKTGAFCLPWLAKHFQDGDPGVTGVQLLVVLPTRELAKQVCDELQRLAGDTPLVALPVYGGTAMVPQLDALSAGVHAVVGTPGRILDHIRRRSLDLSKVQLAVLDECDEMLSMGFLEDIRNILQACPESKQTCLFSATVPRDIARIAERYMRKPKWLTLSTDQISAAEIEHAYYVSHSPVKTRDLLDMVMVEQPGFSIVFCNTREETRFVAGVLQKEGYEAEDLSSDLSQSRREKVLQKMRDHKLHFLVATDIAARGIDISHVSHVINYSFPEQAESYVHRTGRTGRAGRPGQAISLVGAAEIGSFMQLQKIYKSLTFSERKLPDAKELAATRKETKIDALSQRFNEPVSPEWTLLARNLVADPRGEQILAFLLSDAAAQPKAKRREEPEEAPYHSQGDASEWPREGGRGGGGRGRDRNRRGESRRDRGRGRDRRRDEQDEHDEHGGRGERGGRRGRDRGRDRDEERLEARAKSEPTEDTREITDAPETRDPDTHDQDTHDQDPSADLADTETGAEERSSDSEAREDGGGRRRRRRRRGRGSRDEGASDEHADAAGDSDADSTEALESLDEADRARAAKLAEINAESDTDDDDAEVDPALAVLDEGDGRKRRRRRRRRGKGKHRDGDEQGREADGESDSEDDDSDAEGVSADGDDAETDDDGAPKKKRRRRRRRRKSSEGEESRADGETSPSDEDDAGDESGEGGKKKRRRRRRRGKGSGSAAAEEATPEFIEGGEQPKSRLNQDEILIDIDEDELEVVRAQFGEIDTLSDLTLKARRRDVMDDLRSEVVLEDLSENDLEEEDDEDDDHDESDSSDAKPTGDAASPASGKADADADTAKDDDAEGSEDDDGAKAEDDSDRGGKKKRRRRRRKKKAVPFEAPELTAPPHHDFWEVWSEKYSIQSFLEAGQTDDAAIDAEDEKRREAARIEAEAKSDDVEFVALQLNIGRNHGQKSADIRELLRKHAGLTGRAIRDLTVRSDSTLFRAAEPRFESLQKAFVGIHVGDIALEVSSAEEDTGLEALRVPPPPVDDIDPDIVAAAKARLDDGDDEDGDELDEAPRGRASKHSEEE